MIKTFVGPYFYGGRKEGIDGCFFRYPRTVTPIGAIGGGFPLHKAFILLEVLESVYEYLSVKAGILECRGYDRVVPGPLIEGLFPGTTQPKNGVNTKQNER
jgi:hypothetical protein